MNPIREQGTKFTEEYKRFVTNVANLIRFRMKGTTVYEKPTTGAQSELVVTRNGIEYHITVYPGYVVLQDEKFTMNDEGQKALIDKIARATDR